LLASSRTNSGPDRDFEVKPSRRGGFDGRSRGSSTSNINPAKIKTTPAMFMEDYSFHIPQLHSALHTVG